MPRVISSKRQNEEMAAFGGAGDANQARRVTGNDVAERARIFFCSALRAAYRRITLSTTLRRQQRRHCW